MAQKGRTDWENRDVHVGPPQLLAGVGSGNPYNLFGLKGASSDDIREAWYGPPDHRYTQSLFERQPLWKKIWTGLSFVAGFILLARYIYEDQQFRDFLAQHQWMVWLSLVVLAGQLVLMARGKGQLAEVVEHRRQLQETGVMTVLLRVPGSGLRLSKTPHTTLHRKRGDPPLWSRDLPKGNVLVVLEGLTPEEANRLYSAVLALRPS